MTRTFGMVGRCALALVLVAVSNQAAAVGLDLLVAGESLTSGDLTFDDFEAVASGSISDDLSLYDVAAIDGGVAISGPFDADGGAAGDLVLKFTVSSASGPISGVGLSFDGTATGAGSSASVTETFEGVDDVNLLVFVTGGGGSKLSHLGALPGTDSLRVTKDILVDSAEGGTASISRVEQTFEVPEAGAALVIAVVLAGTVLVRREQVAP
jgi:hypothetical protein